MTVAIRCIFACLIPDCINHTALGLRTQKEAHCAATYGRSVTHLSAAPHADLGCPHPDALDVDLTDWDVWCAAVGPGGHRCIMERPIPPRLTLSGSGQMSGGSSPGRT
jgi:hypothetical protein